MTLPEGMSTQYVRENLLKGLDEINATDWNQTIQKKQEKVDQLQTRLAKFTQELSEGKIQVAG